MSTPASGSTARKNITPLQSPESTEGYRQISGIRYKSMPLSTVDGRLDVISKIEREHPIADAVMVGEPLETKDGCFYPYILYVRNI